jgi:hypothetical protein
MQVSNEVLLEMEKLFNEYAELVGDKRKDGLLKESAADTYILHSRNFIRWCKGEFVPGDRNKNNGQAINAKSVHETKEVAVESKDLEKKFYMDMRDIYFKADKECGYKATRFMQMIAEKGGIETAKNLVTKKGGTEGFEKLWQYKRLDLSVEALVLRAEYKSLFSDEIRAICRQRLKEYGFIV